MNPAKGVVNAPSRVRRLCHAALLRAGGLMSPSLWRRIEGFAALQQGKGFGAATCALEVRQCADLLGRKPATVLDVGANRGDYSAAVLAAFPECVVHAIEPSIACVSQLKSRFSGCSRVTIHEIALSESSGEECLYTDREGSPLASLVHRRLDHFGITMRPSGVVVTSSLDDFMAAQRLESVDWIKLDVEGHELAVLRGATNALRTAKLVQFEFGGGNICSRTFFQDFWYLLQGVGFDIYRLSHKQPIRVPKYEEALECFRTTNYVGVRRAHPPAKG